MKYRLKIDDCGADGSAIGQPVEAVAEGSFSGGVLSLEYVFDNSLYRLQISGDRVISLRSGDSEIFLEFVAGKRTCGSVKSGSAGGSFPVFTRELKIILSPNGCKVRLAYSGGEEEEGAAFKSITAYALK